MKKFWNWARDETAPDARVLRLEGTIAEESWFDDDVTPAAFKGSCSRRAARSRSGSTAPAGIAWPLRRSTTCSWTIPATLCGIHGA